MSTGGPTATPDKPPRPPTSLTINTTALALAAYVVWWLMQPEQDVWTRSEKVLIAGAALAVPIILLEALFLRPWRNPSAGLDFSRFRPDLPRALTKLAAFYTILALAAFVYWLVPEYNGVFYDPFHDLLLQIIWGWVALAIPYFIIVDGYMRDPHDGYWHLGAMLLHPKLHHDKRIVGQLMLGWLVKLFFLPLMFTWLGNNLIWFRNFDLDLLDDGFRWKYHFGLTTLFTIDLLFAAVGYAMTFRIFDSHIRSVEPSLLGWFVALAAYQPFWGQVGSLYLGYSTDKNWMDWWANDPTILAIWGSAILALIAFYSWATMAFGIRFSNLTHRGILTQGPYRITKHPAYVSKNASWWLISMPFMVTGGWPAAIQASTLLLGVNFLYMMRARTEERHLSRDPTYVAYAEFMERHGAFAWVGKIVPPLRFSPGSLFYKAPAQETLASDAEE